MAMATNIILVTVFISGFLQVVDPTSFKSPFTTMVESLTGKTFTYDSQGQPQFTDASNSGCLTIPVVGQRCFGSLNMASIFLAVLGLAAVGGLLSIIPGLNNFPNPYLIFSALAIFAVAFFTFPMGLLTQTTAPAAVRVIFIPAFMGSYLLAFIWGYKGGEV